MSTEVLVAIVGLGGVVIGAGLNVLVTMWAERSRLAAEDRRRDAEHGRADAAAQQAIAEEALSTLTSALDRIGPRRRNAEGIERDWFEWSDATLRGEAARLRDPEIRTVLLEVAAGMGGIAQIVDGDTFASDPPDPDDWAVARAKGILQVGIDFAGAGARGEKPDERLARARDRLRRDLEAADLFL